MIAYELITLKNSVRLYIVDKPQTPRVAINVSVKGGIRNENIPGDLRVAARLTLKGTKKYQQKKLAQVIDENALSISHTFSADYSLAKCVALNDRFDVAIDVLKEILLCPTFDRFEEEIPLIMGELTYSLDMPTELVSDILNRDFFKGHPYGYTISLFAESISKLSKEGVAKEYFKIITPKNLTIIVVCDTKNINKEHLIEELERNFGSFENEENVLKSSLIQPITKDTVVTKTLPRTNQAYYMTAWQTIKRGDDNQAAMTLFANILGGNSLTSRLFLELRDAQGLAYGVFSQYIPYQEAGQFFVSISTLPQNLPKVKLGFGNEIKRMQDHLVPDDELERVKNRLVAAQLISSQTNSNVAAICTNGLALGFDINFVDNLYKRIENITSKEVLSTAQTIDTSSITAIVSANEEDFLNL